jgi:hypothetical protein
MLLPSSSRPVSYNSPRPSIQLFPFDHSAIVIICRRRRHYGTHLWIYIDRVDLMIMFSHGNGCDIGSMYELCQHYRDRFMVCQSSLLHLPISFCATWDCYR